MAEKIINDNQSIQLTSGKTISIGDLKDYLLKSMGQSNGTSKASCYYHRSYSYTTKYYDNSTPDRTIYVVYDEATQTQTTYADKAHTIKSSETKVDSDCRAISTKSYQEGKPITETTYTYE